MSARLQKHSSTLCFLCKSKPSVIRSIIKDADKDFIDCVSECCCNVLKGNVALTSKQKSKLLKHKTALRSVAKKNTSLKRKKVLIQKGGFLSALIGPYLVLLFQLCPVFSKENNGNGSKASTSRPSYFRIATK